MNARFQAIAAARSEEPLLLGVIGPPGGGKTLSALKMAKGIQSVRGGPIVVIDTEGGRSRKYSDLIKFDIVELSGKNRPNDFLDAIKAQLPNNPAAIIIDSMSDEHEGEGGYLEWHDEMVPKMGNNEWAAWAAPKASRKKLISGILKIKTPLIFTFRAREKTKQNTDPNAKRNEKIINIGWQPVAPLEIVHTLDLTCILPPRADGVPTWHSDKIGEDFIIKLPNYLAPYIQEGKPLSEEMGAHFARWAKGSPAPPQPRGMAASSAAPSSTPQTQGAGDGAADEQPDPQAVRMAAPSQTPSPAASIQAESGAATVPTWQEYCDRWEIMLDNEQATAKQIGEAWNSADHKAQRRAIIWPAPGSMDPDPLDALTKRVSAAISNRKNKVPA